ncbi:hypothetical protein L2Y96_12790 [Luteibacter aegosomaticola]|uniref:hypothetical protein n=1 Tax=Luteibacter aegosomaticola TaxID=2911538 RepID=UPI001FF855C9|nr:hypothetical protein [Luteibacter aegosomaticola]UPG88297.1 hypothetical protein L2Y96_12790 [Luteibacter aegosomaticola]
MTVLWLVLAATLMFCGRFGTDRIKDDNWSEVAFRASQVAMLACLGMAFFSLFDPPARSSPPMPGPGAEFWPTVGGLIAVVVGLWALGAVAVRLLRHRRLSRDELTTPELTLTLDRAAGRVLVALRGNIMAHPVAMGRLVFDASYYEDDGQQRAKLSFRQWPAAGSLSPVTAQRGMHDVVRVDVWKDSGLDVTGWLRLHPGIELDAGKVTLDWQTATDALVRYCREQRLATGTPAVEVWEALDGPALRYLVIEADGRMYGGVGEHPLIERLDSALVAKGGNRILAVIGDHRPVFTLSADQAVTVQKLHGKGLLSICPAT